MHEAGEGLRAVGNMHTAAHSVREVFTVTPTETDEDWTAVAERLRAVPAALRGYLESLALGLERELYAGPRPTATFIGQLGEWSDLEGKGLGWFEDFASAGPEALRTELVEAARVADAAVVELRDWMRDVYAPAVEGAPNTVGRERVRALVALLERHGSGPGRGVRIRLGRVPPSPRRDEAGGRGHPARRRDTVGWALAHLERARQAHRGRRTRSASGSRA